MIEQSRLKWGKGRPTKEAKRHRTETIESKEQIEFKAKQIIARERNRKIILKRLYDKADVLANKVDCLSYLISVQ